MEIVYSRIVKKVHWDTVKLIIIIIKEPIGKRGEKTN